MRKDKMNHVLSKTKIRIIQSALIVCQLLVLALSLGLVLNSQAQAQTVTYIHTDGLGSPVAKSDASGNLIANSRTRYEPYGMAVAGTATPTIGFTGHVNDADTGLTYMQQRYYDPVAGRFLSTDPVLTDQNSAAHFNRYTYALNNPYKYIDPDGRMPFLVPFVVFIVKEVAAEAASQATGGATDLLSARRMGTKAIKAIVKNSADDVAVKAKILGNAQNTKVNGQNTTHASLSERNANEMAESGEYSSVHMHQKVSTITNGQLSSGVLPDVAGVRKDNGLIDVVEVLSGKQTPAQMQKKITGALGSKCGTVTCVKQD
jgi:RHS repeat-associated protein